MRLQLDLKTITADKKVAQKLLIKVIVNETLQFKTDWAKHQKENVYPFYEKNKVLIPEEDIDYIKFQIRDQNRFIISEKTVLHSQNKGNTELTFLVGKDKIKLHYSLIETLNWAEGALSYQRKSRIDEEPEIMKSKEGRLEISKLGSVVYHFSQRLDPMIWLQHETEFILSWKSPGLTMVVGIVLTFVIMNLKLSIIIGSVGLMFGKGYIFKRIQKINRKRDVHKRILVPKENTVFMQDGMKTYSELYEKIHDFCLSEDKTDLINFVNHICKFMIILVVLLFIFDLETLVVMGVWVGLIAASPSGANIFRQMWPSFLYFERQTERIKEKINDYYKKAMGNPHVEEREVIKEFYFYEFQRWILGKGWSKPIGLLEYHIADVDGKIALEPKVLSPQSWVWITDYEVDYVEGTDINGYEYKNDISKSFSNSSKLATVRRRRFVRKCKLLMKTRSDPIIVPPPPAKGE